ncbi:MAG TPA: VWA domain-containing protein [Bacteroidia bacterium]|jgi:Ca-activated chloride channel family protein|nr:VWA domain-containing protein [Bacteroidia bacterium]
MLQMAHKIFYYALAVIPVTILVYWLAMRMRKKAIKNFAEISLYSRLAPESSVSKKNLKFILSLIAITLLVWAMIDPEIGMHPEKVERKGSDIVICLDVSNSMNAQDIMPSRLERAKEAIEKLITELHGDRIGLVVFAGEPFVQLPLTTDAGAAKMFLGTINTSMIPVQGTSIGSAIDTSVGLFTQQANSNGRSKSIILITDGENFEDDALSAAKSAAEKGIVIHTIAMGSAEGAPIPTYSNGQQSGFMKDKDGNTVVTKLDLNLMQQIAVAGNGSCVRASTSDAGLETILDQIRRMGTKSSEETIFRDHDEQFELFIIPALLILLIDIFITEKKTKWYQRLNLFGAANGK